jgi:hypothetical protein
MHLSSSAFIDGSSIPTEHTADGKNISPELHWSGEPVGTQSFVLICDDPDAPRGTWVHWVLFNLPPEVHKLPTHVLPERVLSNGARHGTNDFHKIGYGGPAPPPGKPHRYFFKIYALDTMLDLKEGATKHQVETAMKGHILAEGHLLGKYSR